MRKEFLMDTIGQAKDTYVMEAGMEGKTKRTGKRFWKVLAAAALIPALVLTAYATDFLNIKSLLSGPERFQSSSYSQMDRAMDKAGFQIDAKERFENGYAFSEVRVSDTMGLDENDRTVLTYREISHPKVGHFLVEGRYYYGLGNIYGDSKRDYFGSSNFGTITVKLAYLFDIVRTRRQ